MIVLFDFGGTLDADGTRWSVRFHAAYRDAGGRLPFDRFEPLFRESDRRLAQMSGIRRAGFRTMLALQGALLAELVADQDETIDPAALADPVYRDALATITRNRAVLAPLAREHRLGIVSNFTGNLDVCLAELALRPLFDVVIDSGTVGMTKPDPRIFELALAALREPGNGSASGPDTAWMIGDNPAADLLPAAALGLHTCWLAPADETHQRFQFPAGVPTARIASLADLAATLEVRCTA
jgi:HAD superfamily hydrolase (TIGR01549 family)